MHFNVGVLVFQDTEDRLDPLGLKLDFITVFVAVCAEIDVETCVGLRRAGLPLWPVPLVDTQSWFHARTLQQEWTHFFQNFIHYPFETLLIESPETPPCLPRLVGERYHCRYGIRTNTEGEVRVRGKLFAIGITGKGKEIPSPLDGPSAKKIGIDAYG